MRPKKFLSILPLVAVLPLMMGNNDCNNATEAASASGVHRANVEVSTGSDGLTVEQRNIKDRLAIDNKPGSLKHLYVISSVSGQVILYSTVRGKVTSGNKRLTPKTVFVGYYQSETYGGFTIPIAGTAKVTGEVLGDDGAYGDSGDYLFWFDAAGRYHQQYTDGCIIHVSDQPIPAKAVTINLEQVVKE